MNDVICIMRAWFKEVKDHHHEVVVRLRKPIIISGFSIQFEVSQTKVISVIVQIVLKKEHQNLLFDVHGAFIKNLHVLSNFKWLIEVMFPSMVEILFNFLLEVRVNFLLIIELL